MTKPIVAIVGRPNVGKSTFFNRLIGERRAIIEDEPGTTRDRLYGETFWNGREFTVADTAGLLFDHEDPTLPASEMMRRTREQAKLAIDEADAIIFVVDGREGLTTADAEVADILAMERDVPAKRALVDIAIELNHGGDVNEAAVEWNVPAQGREALYTAALRVPEADLEAMRRHYANPRFALVEQDVAAAGALEAPAVRAAVGATLGGRVDAVMHLASPASPVDYYEHPIATLDVGSLGTRHLLELCAAQGHRAGGARFLVASTSEVYGDPHVHPQPEGYWGHVNPVGPRGVYDEAKRYAEAMTTAYRSAHGVDTGIVRIFNTFGPRMRPHDGRAIPTFIRQALAGAPVTVAGDGSQTRSVCYVDDLVTGILALATSGQPGPVNIGNPHELTVRQIAEDVVAATGSSSVLEFVARPVDDPQVRRPDTTLARELLGWEPAVPWAEGLERTVAWFAASGAAGARTA